MVGISSLRIGTHLDTVGMIFFCSNTNVSCTPMAHVKGIDMKYLIRSLGVFSLFVLSSQFTAVATATKYISRPGSQLDVELTTIVYYSDLIATGLINFGPMADGQEMTIHSTTTVDFVVNDVLYGQQEFCGSTKRQTRIVVPFALLEAGNSGKSHLATAEQRKAVASKRIAGQLSPFVVARKSPSGKSFEPSGAVPTQDDILMMRQAEKNINQAMQLNSLILSSDLLRRNRGFVIRSGSQYLLFLREDENGSFSVTNGFGLSSIDQPRFSTTDILAAISEVGLENKVCQATK